MENHILDVEPNTILGLAFWHTPCFTLLCTVFNYSTIPTTL